MFNVLRAFLATYLIQCIPVTTIMCNQPFCSWFSKGGSLGYPTIVAAGISGQPNRLYLVGGDRIDARTLFSATNIAGMLLHPTRGCWVELVGIPWPFYSTLRKGRS